MVRMSTCLEKHGTYVHCQWYVCPSPHFQVVYFGCDNMCGGILSWYINPYVVLDDKNNNFQILIAIS